MRGGASQAIEVEAGLRVTPRALFLALPHRIPTPFRTGVIPLLGPGWRFASRVLYRRRCRRTYRPPPLRGVLAELSFGLCMTPGNSWLGTGRTLAHGSQQSALGAVCQRNTPIRLGESLRQAILHYG